MSTHSELSGKELHEPYNYVQEADPGAVGANLYWLKVSAGSVKRRNPTNSGWNSIGGGGASTFTGLSDVPNSYSGQNSKLVAVKSDASGLEFITNTATLPDWLALSPDATPASPNALDDEFNVTGTLDPAWTATNKNGYVTSVAKSHLSITHTSGESGFFCLHKALPATPFLVTTKIQLSTKNINFQNVGFCLFKAGTQTAKSITWDTSASAALTTAKWSAYGTITGNTSFAVNPYGSAFYARFSDDGTNVTYQFSADGINWVIMLSEARTTTFTADRYGPFVFNNTGPFAISYDWIRVS